MMRYNKTKAKIKAGEVVYGVTVGVNDPNVVELAGALGFDFAVIDCEHDLFNGRDLENIIRAAEVHGMTPIVRMHNNPERILHALDGGAQGILVARVNSAADARAAIDAALFHPDITKPLVQGGGLFHDRRMLRKRNRCQSRHPGTLRQSC